MRTLIAVTLCTLALSGCKVLFPTDVDPCPLPPEKHPEVWTANATRDAAGNVLFWTYTCSSSNVVVR